MLKIRDGNVDNVTMTLSLQWHCVSSNVPHLTCYNLDIHDPITINFWLKCYWESKKSDDALFSHLTYLVLLHCLAKEETQKVTYWRMCVQRSPTAAARLPFSWTMSPKSRPKLKALLTRFRESHSSVSISHESKRLKKSSSDWLNSGNAAIQAFEWKCNFRVSRFAW